MGIKYFVIIVVMFANGWAMISAARKSDGFPAMR